MKKMTFSELKVRARDRFSYILIGCPNFPPSTGTTIKTAFEKLIEFVESILDQSKNETTRLWLRNCIEETQKSWKLYEAGDLGGGRKTIQNAERYFQNAFAKKSLKPRFFAGESGDAMNDKNSLP